MAMWQPAAARSALTGSRSRKPRLLVRETTQKSRWFVWRTSTSGFMMRPTPGTKCTSCSRAVKGVVSRSHTSAVTPVRSRPAASNNAFHPTKRRARRIRLASGIVRSTPSSNSFRIRSRLNDRHSCVDSSIRLERVRTGGGSRNALRFGEPYRVSRRLPTLRDWSHEPFKQILPGASGTGSAVGTHGAVLPGHGYKVRSGEPVVAARSASGARPAPNANSSCQIRPSPATNCPVLMRTMS